MTDNLHKGHRERMKNRIIEHGPKNLADHELLEVLLYYSVPMKDTNGLAHRILNEFGSLSNLLGADIPTIMKRTNVSKNTAVLITLIPEFMDRYNAERWSDNKIDLSSSKTAGEYAKSILNTKTKEKTRTNSSFSNSTTIPPTNYLETRIENVNEFGFAKKRNFKNINYHTSLWYLVANGNIKNQKLIENLNTKKLSTKEKFKLIKQNIFRKGKVSNQIELYQQLSKQEIDVLDNENPEEIIHSEFSIKGKSGKDCIWTVEKVTTSSREVIFQIEFQNTEQFRKQILMPLLITFAQSNSIMKGLINSINEKQFQYRAYSTSSNVLTVNNISKEYAEFILNEIKKVEPTIYNKKIEQIEKQNQKIENEIDYQKANKKSGGFLDVLLLTSIVVFFSILMLIIMFMIWKNNI